MSVVLLLLAQVIKACAKRKAYKEPMLLIMQKEKKEKKTAKGDPLPSQISYKERGLSLCY